MSRGELTVKVDVLDLLIEVLKEHEKTLSALIDRAEELLERAEGPGEGGKRRPGGPTGRRWP